MDKLLGNPLFISYDERRNLIIPGDDVLTLSFCIDHFFEIGNQAIQNHDAFYVALSGGSTPKAIFENLSKSENRKRLNWDKVFLFWSDERAVAPTDVESNYAMAMKAGLKDLSIPIQQIFRMEAEDDIENHAKKYEQLILETMGSSSFDLVMLGMGEDGHTASLFPQTHGLEVNDRLVIANYIPQKNTWRMTLTFDCINAAKHIAIYVLGKSKATMVKNIFTTSYDPSLFPIQKVGLTSNKALWILDSSAAEKLSTTDE